MKARRAFAAAGTTSFTAIASPNHALINGIDNLQALADALEVSKHYIRESYEDILHYLQKEQHLPVNVDFATSNGNPLAGQSNDSLDIQLLGLSRPAESYQFPALR